MADKTVVTNEQPLSSVEIATRQKGPPSVTVKVYHADPDIAAQEALRIYEEVFTIGRDRFVAE
jgi:DNA gyrase inhibitor GyrI